MKRFFLNFKVQVGDIHAAIGPDGANLLATDDLLSFAHENSVQMRIDRVHGFHLFFFEENVPDDHQVSPTHAHVTRKDDNTICRRVNGLA